MTQLFLLFMATVAGVMGGLTLSKRFAAREKYFDGLVALIERLISDIKFSQQPVEKIITEYGAECDRLAANLDEYGEFLRGGTLRLSRGVLTRRELSLVTEFFSRLGTLDLDTQISELTGRREVFAQFKALAAAKNGTFGKACLKLGFLAGLLVGILLL